MPSKTEMEPIKIFSTRPVNFKIIAGWPAGQPVSDRPGRPVFLQKVFVHCSMYVMKIFQKRGGMGEILKFVTLDGGLRKKSKKNFCIFFKNDSILRPFLVKFRFEWPVLSSKKRAQNKHKKHWRAQAKLLDVLSNDILQKAKKWSYNFLAIGDKYLQFDEQQTLNFFSAVLPSQLHKDEKKNYSKSNSVRRIFERGGPENLRILRIMKTRMKIFHPKTEYVFLSKIRWRPKKRGFWPKIKWIPKKKKSLVKKEKGLHSDLVRFSAPNYVKAKKKVFTHRFCAQTLCPSYGPKTSQGPWPPLNTPWAKDR